MEQVSSTFSVFNLQHKFKRTFSHSLEGEVSYRDCYVDAAEGTQALCNDTNDLTCTRCTGKLCNNDFIRRGTKCLKCDGIDCFSADDFSNSVDCPSGGCFVGVNSNGETKRDCASAISTSSSCVKNDTLTGSCLVCTGDYCNTITYPIKGRLVCLECLGQSCEENSVEDKFCERLSAAETCVSVFGSSGNVIERGCSSTVQSVAICNDANSTSCLKCDFNLCNTQSSKLEIFHCVSCDSRDDPSCVSNSSAAASKACTTNQCYSRLLPTNSSVWQHIDKGCVADLPAPSYCNGTECAVCNGDRCNNILYPSDRISCLKCKDSECKESTIPMSSCRLYNQQSQACITLYNTNSEVFYRGCYSEAANGTKEVCDDTSELLCSKCLSQNCNNDTIRRGKKCYKCQGLECFEPNHPADVVDCLSACYMGVDAQGEAIRGCADQFTNTTACGTDDNGVNRCSVCNEDFCNALQFPLTNRLECHTCSDEGCAASEDNLKYCQRYQGSERCVTVFSRDNKVIERGCLSNLMNQNYCSQNIANCLQCPSKGCNSGDSKVSRLCVACDSSTNSSCVTNPSSIAAIYCKDGCYTRVVNGVLTRGCLDDLNETFECVDENLCKFCNDADKCNVEFYPANRKTCHTCVGLANCINPQQQLCINYNQNGTCVTIFNGCE